MVVEHVDVLPVQDRLPGLLAVHHHVLMEDAVHPQIAERHVALHHLQMLLEGAAQPFRGPSRADAGAPVGPVGKGATTSRHLRRFRKS
jgi:hypothetical protein